MLLRPTNYAYPWALVLWGGASPGKRPSTKLAWLTEYRVTVPNAPPHFVGHTLGAKTLRTFAESDIVKTWRHRPTATAVKRAKAKLRKEERA